MYLGVDLTRQQQKQLTRAQAQVSKLAPIVAAAPEGKLKGKRRQLVKAEETIVRLTMTPTPPTESSTIPTTVEPGTQPILNTLPTVQPPSSSISISPSSSSQTPVWYAQPGPAPIVPAGPSDSVVSDTVTTAMTSDTVVSGLPNGLLIVGAIVAFMLLSKRRGA